MIDINSTIFIITLNINDHQLKDRSYQSGQKKSKKKNPKNKIQLYIVTINTNWLKVKVWGKINLPGSIKRICLFIKYRQSKLQSKKIHQG